MTRTLPALLVLLVALVSVPVAQAGPIVYFDNYRSLNVNSTTFSTTATGFFSASTGPGPNRSQNSYIGLRLTDPQGNPYELIQGSASLNSGSDSPTTMSNNLFTSFVLDSPYTARLDAFLSADLDGYAQGYLFDQTRQTMLAQGVVDEGFTRLRYDGVLGPGVYSYYLQLQLNTAGRAQFGGDLKLSEFTPVPEPATMTLVGLGLAAAWRRRRRP